MRKSRNYKLKMKEYDMRSYWDERARAGRNMYEQVCTFGAPRHFNKITNMLKEIALFVDLLMIPRGVYSIGISCYRR